MQNSEVSGIVKLYEKSFQNPHTYWAKVLILGRGNSVIGTLKLEVERSGSHASHIGFI